MSGEIYKVKVGDVFFTVKKTVSMTYNPADSVDDFVKIGGEDMCVEYKFNKSNPTQVELQWLNTEGRKCVHGDMTIKGENTLLLFYLSIQILKLYTPVTHIEFLDNSKFQCVLPNNAPVRMELRYTHYLFHGKTWYQDKFGAYPSNPTVKATYNASAKNLDDPKMKPSAFDFKNNDLKEMFSPIWNDTKTWREFLGRIKTTPNICAKIYPWYLHAMEILLDKNSMPNTWTIDVRKLRFEPIKFSRVERMAGGRIRIKNYVPDHYILCDTPNPPECRKLKYK